MRSMRGPRHIVAAAAGGALGVVVSVSWAAGTEPGNGGVGIAPPHERM